MPRKHRKKHDEHLNEAWAVPYADLMTLLVALFFALFAMSSIDSHKFEDFSRSMKIYLSGGTGMLEHNAPIKTEIEGAANTPESALHDVSEALEIEKEKRELEKLQKALDNYIAVNALEKSLETQLSDEGLMVTITNDVLFKPGSAEVRGDSRYLAEEIGKMLEGTKRTIMVSGHTDDVPVGVSQYRTNWDLSVARAVNFMTLMTSVSNLHESQFSVKGYGEFKPLVPNDSVENRAKNRRVEVLVVPNY